MVVPAPSDSVPVLQRPADTSRIEKTNVSTGPPSALRSDVPSTPLTAVSNVSLIGEHSDFPAVFMRPSFTTRPTGISMPPPAFPFLPPPGGPNELPPFSVLPPMPNAITLPPPGFGQKPISHSRLTNIMAAPSPEAAARPQPLPNKPIASLGCLLDMSCPPPYIRQPASLPISRPIDRPMLGDKPLFEVANQPTASSHIPAGSFPPVVPTGCPLPQTSLPPLGPGHLMSIPPPSASGPASVSTASKFSLANVSIGFASRIVDASKFISRPRGLDDSGQFRYSNQGLQKVHRQPNE
ncbi:unnamed protein product [Toxocara canis]|uniref:WH2 domain-containing protein n=1 Tax=Toxocara canis TaxID=6265 RepID=A0A183U4F3_TOXCA|nr:unnamed protein product [Toxocara canis]